MPDALRVALLGRVAEAREHLRGALSELGADIVVDGDPAELQPEQVVGARPDVLVVSLDASMDEHLDRWDPLLDNPSINVVFDEAEVTRQLAGWDLARWARHLATKVMRAGDLLLPPPPAGAQPVPARDMLPQPGRLPTPADLMADARLEDYTAATETMAAVIEPEPSLAAVEIEHGPVVVGPTAIDDGLVDAALDIDLGGIDEAFEREATAEAAHVAPSESDASFVSEGDFSLDPDVQALAAALDLGDDDALPAAGPERDDFPALDAPGLVTEEAPESAGFDSPPSPGAQPATEIAAATETGGPKASSLFANLELVPLDDEPAAAPALAGGDAGSVPVIAPTPTAHTAPAPAAEPIVVDGMALGLDDLIVGLGLTDVPDPAAPITRRGAMLLVAGMGGPDGVRQFLGALPERVPVPVLVWQHLEAGNHDRLAPQMARASRLPVYLATAGETARPGAVGILPGGIALQVAQDNALAFAASDRDHHGLVEALAAFGRDVAIVVLSGADPAVVEPAMAVAGQDGLVLVQDPATCFDGKAAAALQQAGFGIAAPADLARSAMRHWSM